MRTDALNYPLPPELIATRPAEPRDAARMMVVSRSDSSLLAHRRVADLPGCLRAEDVLVVNDTAVAPARFRGRRSDGGGRVEGLFLVEPAEGEWEVMLKSNGRLREGGTIALFESTGAESGVVLLLRERVGVHWHVEVQPTLPARDILSLTGLTPLPPYIRRARGAKVFADEQDRAWYQTVYADESQSRSVAAPTAGLHFTPELLERIERLGVARTTLTLDVGPGTFQPLTCGRVEDHPIHAERFAVPRRTLESIERARAVGGRAVVVGTTAVRALESVSSGAIKSGGLVEAAETRLLISPPFDFVWTDALLTNFHLPQSSLLALVAAFVGLDRLLTLYEIAVAERYRFYSYGDCMLILP